MLQAVVEGRFVEKADSVEATDRPLTVLDAEVCTDELKRVDVRST